MYFDPGIPDPSSQFFRMSCLAHTNTQAPSQHMPNVGRAQSGRDVDECAQDPRNLKSNIFRVFLDHCLLFPKFVGVVNSFQFPIRFGRGFTHLLHAGLGVLWMQ